MTNTKHSQSRVASCMWSNGNAGTRIYAKLCHQALFILCSDHDITSAGSTDPGMKKSERLWQFYKALTISVTAPRSGTSGAKQVNRKNRTIYFLWPPCKETSWLPKRDVCGWWHWNEKNRCIKTFIYTSSQLGSIKQQTPNMCQAKTKTMSRVSGHGGPTNLWRWSQFQI